MKRRGLAGLVSLLLGVAVFALAGGRAEPRPARAILKTAVGDLPLRLDWASAPENCAAFVSYVRDGLYAATAFDDLDELALFGGKPSRPIAGMASNGNMACDKGPPGEFALPNKRGAVGFRRTVGSCNPQKRSNCTQIYLRTADKPQSDGEFTIFAMSEDSGAIADAIRARLAAKQPVPFTVELRAE